MATFRIDGENVMKTARKIFYEEYEFDKAINLLIDSLQNDEMSYNEIKNLAIQILNGEAEIYNTKDGYDVRMIIPKDERYDFYGTLKSCMDKVNEIDLKIERMANVIASAIKNVPTSTLEGLNQDFYNEFGIKLWDFLPRTYGRIADEFLGTEFEDEFMEDPNEFYGEPGSPRWKQRLYDIFNFKIGFPLDNVDAATLSPKSKDKLLEKTSADYINHKEKDYGFITPEGKFIPVSYGNHEPFAHYYVKENFKDAKIKIEGFSKPTFCDFLVYEKNFILLDNQEQGQAFITRNPKAVMPTKQKDALYEYLMNHKRNKEAKLLFDDDTNLSL